MTTPWNPQATTRTGRTCVLFTLKSTSIVIVDMRVPWVSTCPVRICANTVATSSSMKAVSVRILSRSCYEAKTIWWVVIQCYRITTEYSRGFIVHLWENDQRKQILTPVRCAPHWPVWQFCPLCITPMKYSLNCEEILIKRVNLQPVKATPETHHSRCPEALFLRSVMVAHLLNNSMPTTGCNVGHGLSSYQAIKSDETNIQLELGLELTIDSVPWAISPKL